jgi:SAM-dependent methyltransferase
MTSSLKLLRVQDHSIELTPADDPRWASVVADALRMGICPTERVFDQFLPHELRVVSGQYWTPLFVAVRVAAWLDELQVRTVLDIGSGAGKFCVAVALAGNARLVGVEHRARLVAVARDLARVFEVEERVTFIRGTFGETLVPDADAYYLYNPFGENLFGCEDHLDGDVELGDERYHRDVAAVEHLLRTARVGTLLLTYNGFGGQVPMSYEEVRFDSDMPSLLRMWRKTSRKNEPGETIRRSPYR